MKPLQHSRLKSRNWTLFHTGGLSHSAWRKQKCAELPKKDGHSRPIELNRFIYKMHQNIKDRCTNTERPKYYGKHYPTLEEFFELANCDKFKELWIGWVESDFKKGLSPSPDRIDDEKGYETENFQWLTWQENLEKRTNKMKKVVLDTETGIFYDSIKEAAKANSMNPHTLKHLLLSNKTERFIKL